MDSVNFILRASIFVVSSIDLFDTLAIVYGYALTLNHEEI